MRAQLGAAVVDAGLLEDLRPGFDQFYTDPERFIREVLRVPHLRKWQVRLCAQIKAALDAPDAGITLRVLVRTCRGAGKTYIAAALLLWWMVTRYNSRGLTTARAWAQVERALWPEIHRLYLGSYLADIKLCELTRTSLSFGQTWFAVGHSTDNPANLEGHHSDNAAIRIIDEAKEVADEVFDYTGGMLTSPTNFDLWISTPSMPIGRFWERDMDGGPSIVRCVVTIDEMLDDDTLAPGERAGFEDFKRQLLTHGGESAPLYRTQAMAEYGITGGSYFDCWRPDEMVVDATSVVVQPWHTRWLCGDWGFRDDCVIHWLAQDENRDIVVYRELCVNEKTPQELGRLIVGANDDEQMRAFFFSPDAFARKDSPRTIADEVSAELMLSGIVPACKADNDREGGWRLVYQLLLSGKLKISSACVELIHAIPLMHRAEKNSEDIEESEFDHAPDSLRYGVKSWVRDAKVPKDEVVRRYVEKRMPEVVAPDAPVDWNRIAFLTRRGEAFARRGQIRRKARGYGRMSDAR